MADIAHGRKRAAALGMGLLFVALFFGKPPGISVPIFLACALGTAALGGVLAGKPLRPSQAWTALAACAFAALFAVRSAGELMAADLALGLYLGALFFAPWFKGRRAEDFTAADYASFPGDLLANSLGRGRREALEAAGSLPASELPLARLGRGLLMALPLLLVFALLMRSADLVFAKLAGTLWDGSASWLWAALTRAAVALGVGALFAGLYTWVLPPQEPESPPPAPGTPKLSFLETAVVGACVNALFAVFTAIQAVFLLGGERRIAALGVTYSEYARQGFWQMVAIALLALGLSILAEEKAERSTPRQKAVHKANLCLAAAMTGVMMASAFYRLRLYEQAYGYTVLRFYSHTFTLYVAAVFSLLAVKVLLEQDTRLFLRRGYRATLALFLAWNLANPHARIAALNIERHRALERPLDAAYLAGLSDDAAPAIAASLAGLDPETRRQLVQGLAARDARLRERARERSWPSWHLGEARARAALEALDGALLARLEGPAPAERP